MLRHGTQRSGFILGLAARIIGAATPSPNTRE